MAAKTPKNKKHTKPVDTAGRNTADIRSRRQFAESNSLYRQIKLLVAGCTPWCKDKVRSALHLVSAALNSIRETVSKHRVPAAVQMSVFLVASVAIAAFASFQVLYTTGTTLTYNGVELGTVATAEEAEAALETVEHEISAVVGYEYTLEDSTVSYSAGYTYRSDVEDSETLEAALSSQLEVVEHGYALYVNGQFIGATQTEGALENLLDQVAAPYRNENTVSISFVEEVEVVECDLPVEQFTNLAEIALLLTSTKAGEVTYTVQKGDCWSIIAQDHDMTNRELLALNPGYDIDKLQIGDVLIISNAVPFLTVLVTQMEYYVAEVAFETEYIDDPNMWQGDTAIVSSGTQGTADTTALVTYQGATELKREILDQVIITEPITQVERRGTAPRPSWAPTGTFRWPAQGRRSSNYGWRYIFGSNSFHGGIDIANSVGTDIVAADGGIVTFAGWDSGGYGNLIIIDHQNGYKTYYAHNSKLLVQVGDKVHKGQHIAEMGSTGRSTGSHCHLETRYNVERTNPMNYLP